ncbi:hypothetical protein DSM3645_25582 [Blastopirellula marina DSM 3645]|uniref:Uncharacterized protein n=1 Tax=Blastopirellula marina DSM 3645 TaxID=314230 RepID=A4A0I4_9BACT|nr:hypothetical protein DSM3645_25582 [Blastopirellula marina DSM 3645]
MEYGWPLQSELELPTAFHRLALPWRKI